MKARMRQIIDVHAHILPGVDDGPQDMGESLEMIQMAYEQGIRYIIATPHFRFFPDKSCYHGETDHLRSLCQELQVKAEEMGYKVPVFLGQEIFYFEELPEYLDDGWAISMADSSYVLIEFSPNVSYATILRAVNRLARRNYVPLIAHVERYLCMREKGRTKALVEAGACLQMNYKSLSGGFLDTEVTWCKRQVLNGMIHFFGTDMHDTFDRAPEVEPAASWLASRDPGSAWKIMHENPISLLKDQAIFR